MKKSNKQKHSVDDWLTHDDFKIWLWKDAHAPLDNEDKVDRLMLDVLFVINPMGYLQVVEEL